METETALPTAELTAEVSGQEQAAQQAEQVEQEQPKEEAKEEPKKEKTPEEREIARLRRRVDNLTRKLYEGGQKSPLPQQPIERNNHEEQNDSEALTLSRAELAKLVEQRAKEIAPTITQQQAEIEHRRSVVQKLADTWGKEKFDAFAADLNDAFDGLQDSSGKPKPATDAIFESEDPQALIEYLADPDHAEEAEALGRMNAVRAGMQVARLSAKLASKKAEAKPQASKAPAPIEAERGTGTVSNMPSDKDSIDDWVRKERARLKAMKGN